jgi:multiple sugar transport system permease protein
MAVLSTRSQAKSHPLRLSQVGGWLFNIFLVLIGLLMFLPFYWVLVTSVLPSDVAYALPPKWFPTRITFDNFRQVFTLIPFGLMVLNSIKISLIITLGGIITSTLAAYAFARLRFPGRDIFFVLLLAALMVPPQVIAIPTFVLVRVFGLLDTHEAVYLPALVNVLGIFCCASSS